MRNNIKRKCVININLNDNNRIKYMVNQNGNIVPVRSGYVLVEPSCKTFEKYSDAVKESNKLKKKF